MKKFITSFSLLMLVFLLAVCLYSSCKSKEKPLNITVNLEITGRGYYDFDRGEGKHVDFFSKVTITNKEAVPVSFWMMRCSWWHETLIFDTDSVEFSTSGCDSNFPINVELKPGKSIVFYPVFHSNSSNANQIKIGFIMLKEEELNNHFKDWKSFIRTKTIYWSNPVSLMYYYNNGYRIEK